MEGEHLKALSSATSLDDAVSVVEYLEDACGYRWHPVGDRENNYGQINIGSDPGHALIERVTNAIDAVVEYEAARRGVESGNGNAPQTPREAVEEWFGVESGRVRNLKMGKRHELADRVVVRLLEGQSRRKPTVEVRDQGIGLRPNQFGETILGLGGSNKIDKRFLAGAYGQGGSTALAFSPHGTLIVSRRQPELEDVEDRVGITFVRFRDLDPNVNKNGRYEYLVTQDGNIPSLVPAEADGFDPGTRVVHFDMQIDQYAARLTQLTGSLWWLLQNVLFDPVLPLWAEEHRDAVLKGDSPDRRSIVGNHTRLWEDSRDRIEHYDSLAIKVPDDVGTSLVRVHYWVVRERDGSTSSAGPIDAYVDPYAPVAYTFFGQTHGGEDRRFIRERLSLPYLTKFLIIQVELDEITPYARRDLLSTTRDRLKKSSFYNELRERMATGLSEDRELVRLNDERKEAILSKHSQTERQKMRKRFARLMDRFKAGTDARTGKRDGGEEGRPRGRQDEYEPLEPLPTRDEPTFIRIANKQRPIPVRQRRHAIIRVESDAPNGFLTSHSEARILIRTDREDALLVENWSDFRGGRCRIAVTPSDLCSVGDEGTVRVNLDCSDGSVFQASAPFRIEEPRDVGGITKGTDAEVQAPEPVAIHQNQWEELGWDEQSVAEVREEAENTKIFVNMDNKHLKGLLEAGNYQDRGITRMRNNYLLYTAFYAFLQYYDVKENGIDLEGEAFEAYVGQELDRAAQTVVSSIASISRL